jgi:hypothetical protein
LGRQSVCEKRRSSQSLQCLAASQIAHLCDANIADWSNAEDSAADFLGQRLTVLR